MLQFVILLIAVITPTCQSNELPDGPDARIVILPTFCDPNPCLNGGKCYSEVGKLESSCNCTEGWYGVICSKQLQLLCEPNPCKNDGLCVPESPAIVNCVCNAGYQGEACEELVPPENDDSEDACFPNPCENGCQCRPSCKHELGYVCVSEKGFIGKNCDIVIPRVACLESEIVVDISTEFFNEFDARIRNSYIYIAPSQDSKEKSNAQCQAFQVGNFMQVSVPLPFNGCGTSMDDSKSGSNGITFMNRMWVNRGGSDLFDMPVPVLDFTCIYDRNYSVVTSLMPKIDTVDRQITRSGNFDVRYGLCKVPLCIGNMQECPGIYKVGREEPAVYTVGQMLHFHVKVLTMQDIVFQKTLVNTLEELFLSCDSNPFQQRLVTIASQGCPVPTAFATSVTAGLVLDPQSICASLQVPRATSSGCKTIYLHARILLCDKNDLRVCNSDPNVLYCASARKRRAVDNEESAHFAIGPINVVQGSKGRAMEQLHIGDGYGGVITVSEPLGVDVDLPSFTTEEPAEKTLDACSFHIFYIVGLASLALCSICALLYIVFRIRNRSTKNDPGTRRSYATSA
uniref:Transmembrane protein Vc569 n=1 Tax=Phallusia mammillata TaxID=59560 RepID=A0A6F9DD50_9ASCI|nr:transmembrane protein Vc569 [Phallusia mammillata]